MPTYEEAETLIMDALRKLISEDSYLIKRDLKEEALNHRLAVHLEEGIKNNKLDQELNVDIEYNKNIDAPKNDSNGKPMRPDIIIHERGHNNNFLAIEAKKGYAENHDWEKIFDLLTDYNYDFGCLISYFPGRSYLKYLLIKRESFKEYNKINTKYWKKLEKKASE